MNEEKRLNKHSIRDIEINKGQAPQKRKKTFKKAIKRAPKKQGSFLTLFASTLLFFAVLFLLYAFLKPSSATVEFVSKKKTVPLSGDYVHLAYKNPEPGQLKFEISEASLQESISLQADKKDTVEEKASGILTVYNDYSEKPQRIISRTRFQSPDGKIYRVRKAFTIPGKDAEGPGKVEVKVYANNPGEDYNKPAGIKFSLPALSGEAAQKIYAQSKTEISGGFKGERATVSDEKKKQAIQELKDQLRTKAMSNALSKIGEGFVSFKDAVILDFDDPVYEYEPDKVKVSLRANTFTPVFNKYDFAQELLSVADAELDFDGDTKIYIENTGELDLKLVNKDGFDPQEDEIVKFSAKGVAQAKYHLDTELIKRELAGKNETVARFIKDAYPAIEKISATIKPFWRSSFPENIDKIEVIEIAE